MQALAFAKIERSGHSQQPDTKCQMQSISAKARLLSVDASLSMQASSLRYFVALLLPTPPGYTIKTHAKGAYKTPLRVFFSMQNRDELPFSWQFTLFVVSSRIAVGICSSLALGNRKPLTIVQKGFLHDKERMISSVLINEKMTDRTLTNAVGRLTFISLYSLFPIEADRFYFFAF